MNKIPANSMCQHVNTTHIHIVKDKFLKIGARKIAQCLRARVQFPGPKAPLLSVSTSSHTHGTDTHIHMYMYIKLKIKC